MLWLVRLVLLGVSSLSSFLSQKDEAPMGGNAANMLLVSPSSSSSSSVSLLSSLALFDIEYSRVV